MEELHAAIAAHLRRQRSDLPQRRRTDPAPGRASAVAIYARVALAAVGQEPGLAAQIAACREFARASGNTRVPVYCEVADGDTLERAQLADLRASIALGAIRTVLVATLDRLARDPVLLGALRAEWAAYGVALIAVGDR